MACKMSHEFLPTSLNITNFCYPFYFMNIVYIYSYLKRSIMIIMFIWHCPSQLSQKSIHLQNSSGDLPKESDCHSVRQIAWSLE